MLLKNLTLRGKFKGVINKAVIFGGFGLVVVSVFAISFLAPKGNMEVSKQMYDLASFLPENTLFFANLNISQEKYDLLNKISGNNLTSESIIKNLESASKDQTDKVDVKNLVTEFNKTLEPQATVGVWTDQNKVENVLITTILKDKTSVDALMKNLSTDKTATYKKEMVDGVEVNVSDGEKDGAYSVVDNVLIIGNKLDTVKQALVNHKSNKNFLKSDNVVAITSKLPKNPCSIVLFNASGLTEMAKAMKSNTESENEKIDQINQVAGSMSYSGLGIDINKDILVVKSYTPLNLDSVKNEELKTKINELLNTTNNIEGASIVPADSMFMISIAGVSKILDSYVLTLNEKEKMQYMQSKAFISMVTGGMDLDKDILPIFSNELTVAATFNGKEPSPIIAITKNPESLSVIDKLAKIFTMQDPQSKIQEKDVAGNKISVIASRAIPVQLAFGQVGNMITMGTAPSIEAIADNKTGSLANNQLYKDLSSKIDYKPSAVLFINMEKLAEAMKASNPDPEKIKGIDNLQKSIDGIFFAATNDKTNAVIGNVLVKMKTAN